ncbi:MAG: hypothetical protein F4W92_03945 [Gammaproteobacteria bacterium]|nr:hypothetical protein [Gammaproteobacteria bacterium]
MFLHSQKKLSQSGPAQELAVHLFKEALQIARNSDRVHDKHTELEASGQINLSNIVAVAETGIDCISLGTLIKDVAALDFSMRVQE